MRILFLVLSLVSFTSFADCYGTGAFKHCDDLDSGNSYDIYKYGNTTEVDGYNSRTGSSWNETATTYGNTTYIDGTSANGNTWNEEITRSGNTTYIDGMDSNGNHFSKICTTDYLGNLICD